MIFLEEETLTSAGSGAFGSSFAGNAADSQYAWAERLREIPDKDALQELSMMGYLSGDSNSSGGNGGAARGKSGSSKFSFTRGTGAGGQRSSKRTASGRNGAARAKGRST